MSLDHLRPRSEDDKFLNLSYDDRREKFKPIIVELYLNQRGDNGKSISIAQVAQFMKENYAFHAAESQYKHWFSPKKWNVRKRTMVEEKHEIIRVLGRRKREDTSTSDVLVRHGDNEQRLDKKQLKRHLNDHIRKDQVETMASGALSSWSLPYAALTASITKAPDHPSPFGTAAATPGYVVVNTPSASTPGRGDGPSPAMKLIREAVLHDRSNLFCQGRHRELLSTCGPEDRVILTNYFHDFYIQAFVTAKYWGRGPRVWTGGMVSALTLGTLEAPTPHTQYSIANSPSAHSPFVSQREHPKLQPQTNFCRWVIHVNPIDYTDLPEVNHDPQEQFDVANPSLWAPWTDGATTTSSFTDAMKDSIAESTFTPLPPEDLPISIQTVSRSLQENPSSLDADAWKFAIMAGNFDLLDDLFAKNRHEVPDSVQQLHPVHLAATYLDGGKSCCRVLSSLSEMLPRNYIFRNFIDNHGHTILDTLLITILRSHTTITPDEVSSQLGSSTRFPGEEKDVCGRWDADTPAIRQLFQHGYARIPSQWKHPFCHSSVQAVCHSTIGIFGSPAVPSIDTPSGLFIRRCANCGLELRLGPLHAVIVMSFYLAQKGMAEETLFGSLALLVCLLRLGADVNFATSVSAADLLGTADVSRCNHVSMTARQLMEAVPLDVVSRWTVDCQLGWRCLMQSLLLGETGSILKHNNDVEMSTPQAIFEFTTLGHSPEAHTPESETDDCFDCKLDFDYGIHGEWANIPSGNAELGLLWATIQVEILTHRRVGDTDPWISERFSMQALISWLDGETDNFCTPLVQGGLMREHSPCGWFDCDDFLCPLAEDVCKSHFMNMDVYDRTTFTYRPSYVERWG